MKHHANLTVHRSIRYGNRTVLEIPEVRSRFESMGNCIRIESPAEFASIVKLNRAKWVEVVRAAKIVIQ